ncbi:ATP-binding protein [Acuticoccus sp. I52.16.1]|uniref:ATP-binding protein n=1 Tax=Acuticoccus sp. I52.16.1 TaxID=2928472 RepID=UPI001FD1726B|nr:ATP-binding protein [Acuticoccus sp. I52.16.1]UOM33349.1 ATP-binding protein [Acuticoccus sp. I52.16.1]
MTLSAPLVITVGGLYLALLFLVAFLTDRLAEQGRARFLASPIVYTLSLAVYCTSWTFFGAVGTASRSGIEFVTIYIGPTLALMTGWLFLPKMVRIAKAQRVTSIADFMSSRYGKSRAVAVLVTVIALASITPYIALQLIAIRRSFVVLSGGEADGTGTAFWVAAVMVFFVIVFGTRRVNADESQPGIVAAIAFESIVKLAALLAVAALAAVVLTRDPAAGSLFANGATALDAISAFNAGDGARWTTLMLLSAAAIICLPRQFQVAVVENRSEGHITVASWLFPAYLFLLTLAAVPIAAAGLVALPAGAEPDLYVLTLPLSEGSALLALAAFVGGLSAATSMVIVASLALAVMISNHLVAPLLLGRVHTPGGVGAAVMVTRRLAIAGVIGLGTLYAEAHGAGGGLASIGLIAFAGVAQFAPALLAGLFWRRANRFGATAGLATGAALWVALLLLPSFGVGQGLVYEVRAILLPPEQLFGAGAVDPLVFGVVVSIATNVIVYVLTSLATSGSVVDELQATVFVDALRRGGSEPTLRRSASRRELMRLARRILGSQRADEVFAAMRTTTAEEADSTLIAQVERELAFAVGTSSAHTLVTQIAIGEPLAVDAAIMLLQETQEAIEAARALDIRSVELERSTAELATTNASLKALLAEKDDFLSRVSHEMRTPVTAVRSFAELLREGALDPDRAARFVDIILEESRRLSRLLDDILDLSRLEAGVAPIRMDRIDAAAAIAEAAAVMDGFAQRQGASIRVEANGPIFVRADADRLKQVLVNLLSNAIKFCGGGPVLISVTTEQNTVVMRVRDQGPGIPADVQPRLFGKFISGAAPHGIRGAGLGLAISRQIMRGLGGSLTLEVTGPTGSIFAARLPVAVEPRARLAG